MRIEVAIGLLFLLSLFPVSASARPKMLFVGNSITVGRSADDPSTQGYVALFAERFPEFQVVNAGCGGSSTRDWTSDAPATGCMFSDAWGLLAEPELPAQIFHILLGTNDAYGFFEFFPDGKMGDWLSSEEFESRLRLLAEAARGSLVFISTPPPIQTSEPAAVADRIESYRSAVFAVAKDYWHVRFGVDFYRLLDPAEDIEGCHPNTGGHAVMADALERRVLRSPRIRRLLRHRHGKLFRKHRLSQQRRHLVPEIRSAAVPMRPEGWIEPDADIGNACEYFGNP